MANTAKATTAQPVYHTAKPGFWSTLSSLWSMLTVTITRSERILDESLAAVEELATMAHTATSNMHEEQKVAAQQSLAELKAMG